MILTACGTSPGIAGFPNGGKTTSGTLGGTEHGWGTTKIRANGGVYQICWCAYGYTCVEGVHHAKSLGQITVTGPSSGFFKACYAFADCTWSGMTGQGLQDGDRIMLLEDCGTGAPVPGFPNGDIAVATGGGSSYSFPGGSNLVTAGGHEYAMCWCGAGTGVCASPANFLVNAGTLKILGSRTDNEVSCVQGRPCQFHNFRGQGLANSDKIKILNVCGTGVSPGGFPDLGVVTASNFGTSYVSWNTAVTPQYGAYRLCWCGNGWTCPPISGFKMDAGVIWIVGVNSNQQKTCQNQDGCGLAESLATI
jgi:hypothetical protein